MPDQSEIWLTAAADLGIEIITPLSLSLKSGARLHAAALILEFGGLEKGKGIVVDPKYSTIEPYSKELIESGYGFSAVRVGPCYDRDGFIEMLAEWTWTSLRPMPAWLHEFELKTTNEEEYK